VVIGLKVAEGEVGRFLFFRLEAGSDLLEAIKIAASNSGIRAGLLACIGGLERARLGFYVGSGRYEAIELQGPLELLSCLGNVSEGPGGELIVHAHACVSDGEGRAFGGHLLEGCVIKPTAELALIELSGGELRRELDTTTGLKLLIPSP